MLEVPDKLKLLVSDYKMNLLQIRDSGSLSFHDSDVDTVFDVSRSIYERNYDKINTVYRHKSISSELGVVIGAITESQKLIDHALASEAKGGQVNMCSALEELKQEGMQEGIQQGMQQGIRQGVEQGILANIRTCKNFNISKEAAVKNIMKEFALSEEEANEYMKKYW